MGLRFRQIAPAVLLVTSCGGSSAPPASDGQGEPITGTERIAWDQPASDAGELATFRYAVYVDDVRTEAADASCASAGTNGRFACATSLPQMSAGSHALQIAAFVLDGGVARESSRSATIRVLKQ